MNKFLLFASAVALTAGSVHADQTVYENIGINGFSPNGTYAVSTLYGTLTIFDYANDKQYVYIDDEEPYSSGAGNCLSNTGILVGQKEGNYAAWWKAGNWTEFQGASDKMSIAHGITRNGSRAVGAIQPDSYNGSYEGLMLTPCYWDAKANGTFGEPQSLPFPDKDLTGRTPQYVTAVSVSEDGNTIAGQIMDYSGTMVQPIIYTYAGGKWSYSLPQNQLFHPDGFELPEDPGEAPEVSPETFMTPAEIAEYNKAVEEYYEFQESLTYPEETDFMSEEEYLAYQAALNEFYETWENYPDPTDYMTQKEIDAFNAAVQEYYDQMNSHPYPEYSDFMSAAEKAEYEKAKEAMEIWDEKWSIFSEALTELAELVPSFTFNNVFLSADGSKYYSSFSKEYMDWESWSFLSIYEPWVLNLKNNTYKAYSSDDTFLIITSVTDDGRILAQKPAGVSAPAAQAYILPFGASQFVPLYDYTTNLDPSVATWMKNNLTHTYTDFVWNDDLGQYEEKEVSGMFTGIPFANADMSIIALTVENYWDYSTGANSYIIQSESLGVRSASSEDCDIDVKGLRGGSLVLSGDVASVVVYNLAGSAVYSINTPAATVATGLPNGIYIVKATSAAGVSKTFKVAL